ncbi:MAG: CRISPR-associated endoribonuclease Cas6, partial [Leptolyngbyaceae cyanobacterium SU_3_3]|nr:CRISPR-associated endoribonuclease Cas6 [Leptolyngbyaceae cyanobacterium SU_3_3]
QPGWSESAPTSATVEDILAQRIAELTALFMAQRRRTGGDRASQIAQTWATILARRELGEGLPAIAQDLEMPYETVKTYVKLARRAL